MSINLRQKGASSVLTGKGSISAVNSSAEVDTMVDEVLFEHSYASDECYRQIANILFDNTLKPADDIFSKLARDSQDNVSPEDD